MQVGETSRQRLAELLKELRGERSQRSFAKLLGVSNQAVQYWEKERTWPDDNNLERIAELKGWTLLQLQVYLEGEQERSSVADEDVNRVNDSELQQQSRSVQQLLEEVRMLPFQAAVQVAKVALETMEMMAAKSS
ncbi:helix-turn-helix transcriptional regulator [Brasilonema bromeliae]|uniref:Transcriptional regulator n=1 Tax=Brasilonema bromeliae SPC951 TaxID=385972 RepID=A0ABX1PEX9_9CYAN|nr:helix-turn-helix transcriptional regulator [Brasilonema bromeliae]NMG23054.1 transcriptional regulator [Brasilonema bromeliae SPC951]